MSVYPVIASTDLRDAMRSCQFRGDEDLLAFVDRSISGDAFVFLVVTSAGMHWNNPPNRGSVEKCTIFSFLLI